METRCKTKKITQPAEKQDIDSTRSLPGSQTSGHEGESVFPASETVDLSLILKELRHFHRDNKTQLEDIKAEILNTNTRLEEVEGRVVTAEERIQNTEEVLAGLKLHTRMEEKLTDIEGHSRWNNVTIYRVPEVLSDNGPISRKNSERKSKPTGGHVTSN